MLWRVGADCLLEVALSGSRQDLTDAERELLRSVLPTGCRGPVRRNDRRIVDGIFFILRAGSPWRDLPERSGGGLATKIHAALDGAGRSLAVRLSPGLAGLP